MSSSAIPTRLKDRRNPQYWKSKSKWFLLVAKAKRIIWTHQTDPNRSGREDMGVEGFWERSGVQVNNPQQYHL